MTDDNAKLVAKIQHFYDFALQRNIETEHNCLIASDPAKQTQHALIGAELSILLDEYYQVFKDFLYKQKD